MKLLFIYGPPAVGKTTIGHLVAEKTGYSFFFNHATVPAARAVFPHWHQPEYADRYSDLLKELRKAGIKAAAEASLDTIFTLAYSGEVDILFVQQIIDIVERAYGEIHFVQLCAPNGTLLDRVGNPSRKKYDKMTDPVHLMKLLGDRDLHATIPGQHVLRIDTTRHPPREAAAIIISYFGL